MTAFPNSFADPKFPSLVVDPLQTSIGRDQRRTNVPT